MDNRRRGIAVAVLGASIAVAAGVFFLSDGSFAGLPVEFWLGVPIGISLVLLAFALVLIARHARGR